MNKFTRTFSIVTLALAACTDSSGPGLGPPAHLFILAAQPTGVFGQAVPTAPTVLVTDANGHRVPGVVVTFAITGGGGSVSSTTQTTSATGLASVVWTLGNTLFGTNTLTASVAELPPVTFSTTAIAPDSGILAFNLVDPAGDTLGQTDTTFPKAIDLLSLRGDFKGDALILTATFSGAVTSGIDAPNFLRGYIEFDIDDNPSTGGPFLSAAYGGKNGALGRDYLLSLYGSGAGISDESSNQPPNPVPVEVSYSGSTVVLRVPMSLLGNDDGNFSLMGVIGTLDRATDVFPNSGLTTARRGMGVSSTMNVVSSRPRGAAAAHSSVRWELLAPRVH